MVLAWLINRYGGGLYLFDVFGRIPEPSEADGADAHNRYDQIVNHENSDYYGNISNLLDLILNDLGKICPLEKIKIVPGRYEEVLHQFEGDFLFDFVHIDCDWYESAKAVIAFLEDRITSTAIIQVDDYENWAGANCAVRERGWLVDNIQTIVDGAAVIDLSKNSSKFTR